MEKSGCSLNGYEEASRQGYDHTSPQGSVGFPRCTPTAGYPVTTLLHHGILTQHSYSTVSLQHSYSTVSPHNTLTARYPHTTFLQHGIITTLLQHGILTQHSYSTVSSRHSYSSIPINLHKQYKQQLTPRRM